MKNYMKTLHEKIGLFANPKVTKTKLIKNIFLAYILICTLLLLLSGSSGFMMNTVNAIGHRTEDLDEFSRFTIFSNKLHVEYTTHIDATDPTNCNASFFIERSISTKVKHWGVVDLDSGWSDPQFKNGATWWDSSRSHSLVHSEEQLPIFAGKNFTKLEPFKEAWYHQIAYKKSKEISDKQIIQEQIQKCSGNGYYCINFPYGVVGHDFVILKNEDKYNTIQCKFVTVWEEVYYEPWSKYVHFVLIPFAFIFDVIAFPLTLLANLCM